MSVPATESYAIGWPPTVTLPDERVSLAWKNCFAGDDEVVFLSADPSALEGFVGCDLGWRGCGAEIAGADASSVAIVRAERSFIIKLLQPSLGAASGFAAQVRRSQISTGHSPIPASTTLSPCRS